jgi:GDP-D-mannose dehydratase
MLGLAKRVKARILLASTSEIYGDPEVHPQPEVSSFLCMLLHPTYPT